MVEFLDTNEISSEITKIVVGAKERLYLVSPYLQVSDRLKILIKQVEKTSPKIDIKVLYRPENEGEHREEDVNFFLNQLNNASVYSLENLHAKCYLNEYSATIASMNLYQHSQENNWEMGVKIDKSTDPVIYNKVIEHVSLLINASKKHDKELNCSNTVNQTNYNITRQKMDNRAMMVNNGYCIRCGIIIDYNLNKPLCSSCFKSWSRYMDDSYQEQYCHSCGNEDETSFSKPLCIDCYKEINHNR